MKVAAESTPTSPEQVSRKLVNSLLMGMLTKTQDVSVNEAVQVIIVCLAGGFLQMTLTRCMAAATQPVASGVEVISFLQV